MRDAATDASCTPSHVGDSHAGAFGPVISMPRTMIEKLCNAWNNADV